MDLVGMRSEVEILQARLKGAPSWEQVRSIYMDLAPLIGETIRRIHENMSVSALFT